MNGTAPFVAYIYEIGILQVVVKAVTRDLVN
jgi:hypothetical protein